MKSIILKIPPVILITPRRSRSAAAFDYAAGVLNQLSREFGFRGRWAFCARYLKGKPTAGLPLKRIRQLYRDADAILNVCGSQEFNDDLLASDRILYVESDPAVEQIKVDKGVRSTIQYLRRHQAPLYLRRKCRHQKRFPSPPTDFDGTPPGNRW